MQTIYFKMFITFKIILKKINSKCRAILEAGILGILLAVTNILTLLYGKTPANNSEQFSI